MKSNVEQFREERESLQSEKVLPILRKTKGDGQKVVVSLAAFVQKKNKAGQDWIEEKVVVSVPC